MVKLLLVMMIPIIYYCKPKKEKVPQNIKSAILDTSLYSFVSPDSLYKEAIKLYEKDNLGIGQILFKIAYNKGSSLARIDSALTLYQIGDSNQSYRLLDSMCNINISDAYIQRGILYVKNSRLEYGIFYMEKGLFLGSYYIAESLGHLFLTGENQFSKRNTVKPDTNKAIKYYYIGAIKGIASCQYNLGKLYLKLNKMDSAKKYFESCVKNNNIDEHGYQFLSKKELSKYFK